jgi:hypothetical protein
MRATDFSGQDRDRVLLTIITRFPVCRQGLANA